MKRMTAVLLTSVLLATAGAAGGPQKEQPPSRLEAVLKSWSSVRKADRQSHYKLTWTVTDDFFGDKRTREVWHGEVFLQRPDRLRVEMKNEKGQLALVVLLTGRQARLYHFDRKLEQKLTLPDDFHFLDMAERCRKEKPGLIEGIHEGLLWLVLSPPSQGLGARFVPQLEKEDDHWSWIRLKPKWSFWLPDHEWQIVLHKRDGWVKRVWCSQGSDWVTVEREKPEHKPLPPSTWEPLFKDVPKGWTRQECPSPGTEPTGR